MQKRLNWRVCLRMAVLLLVICSLATASKASANTTTTPHWRACFEHLDWSTMSRVVSVRCWSIPMHRHSAPTGWWHRTDYISPHVRREVAFPIYPAPIVTRTITRVDGSYTLTGGYPSVWQVTWYAATGNRMANGQYPYIGAAACGGDVALGTRVTVPGLGTFTCGDRMCSDCPGVRYDHHIDLFEVRPRTSYANVTVIP